MRNSAPQPASAWFSLPAALPEYLRAQARAIGCTGRAATIINAAAIEIFGRQADIVTREMDLAARWLGAIAPRSPALRATCIEISRDDLDMIADNMRQIGQIAVTCNMDLVDIYAGCLTDTATPTTSPAP